MENLRSIYGIHATLGWIAFMKHRITRKGEEKDEKHIKKIIRKIRNKIGAY